MSIRKMPRRSYKILIQNQNTHRVVEFVKNTTRFRIKEIMHPREIRPVGKFVVRLDEWWCDYGKFQKIHLLCSHVLAAYKDAYHDFDIYISHHLGWMSLWMCMTICLRSYDMKNISYHTKTHKYGLIQPQKKKHKGLTKII